MELQNVPFDEQIRIMQQAEKFVNHHPVSPPFDFTDRNSVVAFDDFNSIPEAVAKDYGWGDLFQFSSLYKVSLDLKTGKVTQSCNDEP
jgi:hypothetical protein